MAEHRRIAAAAALCIVAGGVVAACDSDEIPERSAAASPSPTGEQAASAGVEDAPSASAGRDTRCVRAERNEAGSPWTWRVVDEVAESPTGHSARARASVERFVATTRTRLAERCGGTSPPAFRDFSREIRRILVDDSFGNQELDRVLEAWSRWGTGAGEPREARRTIREVRSCRELLTRFDATYRTWWRWTSTGKAWWIDITWQNRTGRTVAGSSWGWVKATEMLRESLGPQGEPGPTRVQDAMMQWGASSNDSFNAPPGRTVWRVPLDDIHTTAAGTIQVTEMAYSLFSLDETHDCNAPVLPAPL